MNKDQKDINGNRKGNNRNKNHDVKRNRGDNNRKTTESITLPYSFIPFAKNLHFPYTYECLPKHNEFKGISGSISYTITPESDLFIETRMNKDGQHFLSGSSARGLVRSNVEILSASYPRFIDRTQMLYRDVASNKKDKRYLQILVNKDQQFEEIEREIEVGYLQKLGNDYYVIPAKKFSNGKNFISIKEHILKDWNVLKTNNYLFEDNTSRKIKVLQHEIDELTPIIKRYRKFLNSDYKKKIGKLFLKEFNFHKKKPKFYSMEKLVGLEEELVNKLKDVLVGVNLDQVDCRKLSEAYAKRWILKFKMTKEYQSLKRNNSFKPYRSLVYFKESVRGGVSSLSRIKSEEHPLSCCIFNSTNASSKRSHYIARESDNERDPILVPQTVIASYNKMKKKMRTNETNKEIIEKFYDIFNSDRNPKDNTNNHFPIPVVFYQVAKRDDGNTVIDKIGATPYFKVPYDYQLNELIGDNEKERVDYATALFGYINEGIDDGGNASKHEDEGLQSFKSRVRFGPIDIIGNPMFSNKPVQLLLPSPSATAQGMYLKQDQPNPVTYEKTVKGDQKKPELNGYKYYHVLEDKVNYFPKKDTENMESKRKVLTKEGKIKLKGKIHFTNLTKNEIGLLLLGVDISLFHEADLFKQIFTEEDLNECYELIGGAKPYGYGKVKIKVDSLNLETRGNDFQSLMLSKEDKKEGAQLKEYINSFVAEMNGTKYFENVHLANYLQSKKVFRKIEGIKHYNWPDFSKDRVGYEKEWRLLSPKKHIKKN